VNIQDAIDVIESVSGFTDKSTPVGEAWAEVLSYVRGLEDRQRMARFQLLSIADELDPPNA
jgi:hypothetical protein